MNTAKVTRFQVVDEQGQACFVREGVEVFVDVQPGGRTLKVHLAARNRAPDLSNTKPRPVIEGDTA